MPETIFWVGHARLPEGMPAKSIYDTMGLALETDSRYYVVLRASCTLVTAHGQEFIEGLLIGHSLLDGIVPLIDSVETYYMGKGKRAIISCLKDISKQFNESRRPDRTNDLEEPVETSQ